MLIVTIGLLAVVAAFALRGGSRSPRASRNDGAPVAGDSGGRNRSDSDSGDGGGDSGDGGGGD